MVGGQRQERAKSALLSGCWFHLTDPDPVPYGSAHSAGETSTVHAGTCSSRDPECNLSGSSWTGKDLKSGHALRERRVHGHAHCWRQKQIHFPCEECYQAGNQVPRRGSEVPRGKPAEAARQTPGVSVSQTP